MSRIAQTVSAFALRRRPDDDVFREALQGNATAFSEVYRRYHERVFAYCLARLLSADAAHDATNETFLRLLSADPGAVRSPAWIFGVARHVCIDVARREGGVAQTALEEHDAAGTTRAAEDEVLSQEEARTVLLALRRVRPRYRAALMLREIHHESIASIAESLGVNTATASTVLSRARDAFGRAYAEVLQLENGCREAVELIYRRGGSGLSASENAALEAHLASCSSCRREAGRASETLSAPALLLLPQIEGVSRGLLARAAELFARNPALASVPSVSGPALDAPATRIGAAVVTALVALTVGVNALAPGGRTSVDPASEPRPAVAADTAVSGSMPSTHETEDGGTHSGAAHGESRHDPSLLHLSEASVHDSRQLSGESAHSAPHEPDGMHALDGATGGEHGSTAGTGGGTGTHDATGDGSGTGTSTGTGGDGTGSGDGHDAHAGGTGEPSHD